MWNPDNDTLPHGPLTPIERQGTRRVLKWYERRAFLRASLMLWGQWLILLPASMLAAWGVVQLFLHGR